MAGRIAQHVIREVITRTDMRAIVSDAVRLQRAGGASLKGLCPFHDEKTPSFTINLGQKVYYCHGCGAGGDVISFVRETRGLTFIEAVEWLAERAGVAIEREDLSPEETRRRRAERSQRARLLDLNRAAHAWFQQQLQGPAGASARAYLRERGLSDETAEVYGVGCAPDAWEGLTRHLLSRGFEARELLHVGLSVERRGQHRSGDLNLYDRFRDRLMFPVRTSTGDLVAFGGRDLSGSSPAKYMNSPESELGEASGRGGHRFYKKTHIVFGLHVARRGIRSAGMAVLVEGNLDVMMLHQHGVTSAVCPMGTAVTTEQLSEIKRFTDRVALVFDGDKAGRAAMMKTVPRCLEVGLDGVYVLLPEGEDPDTLLRSGGRAAWDKLLDRAESLVTGWIDAVVQRWDGTIRGKAEILEQVAPVLAAIPDPISREMAQDHLGTRLLSDRIEDNRRSLRSYLAKARPQHGTRASSTPAPAQPVGPPVPPVELELARSLMWHPDLIPDVQGVGGLDLVTHVGLHAALTHVCAHVDAAGEVHAADLPGWLATLPDDLARRALLAALAEPPRVSEDNRVGYLEHVLDRLEIEMLRRHKAELDRASRDATDDAALMQLLQDKIATERRIQELSQQGPSRADATLSTPDSPQDVPQGVTLEGSAHV